MLGHVPLALIALPFVPTPAIGNYPYLGGGILLHADFQAFLLKSYQNGDLAQVYPIGRGSAPLLVAVFSAAVLGVTFEPLQTLAIVIIGCGILSLALVRRADRQRNTHAAKLALVTGVFIAPYSLVDGLGARLAETSLGFYSWLFLGNRTLMAAYLAIVSPKTLRKITSKGCGVFFDWWRGIPFRLCHCDMGLYASPYRACNGVARNQHCFRAGHWGLFPERTPKLYQAAVQIPNSP